MLRSRKTVLGLLGVVALVVIAGLGITAFFVRNALAQSATPTQQTPNGSTAPANIMSQYEETFFKALASRLGIDEAKLKTDIIGAIGDTLDQAVKDGKITQAQAGQIKNDMGQGINSGNFPFFGFGKGHGRFPGYKMGRFEFDTLGPAEFAKALDMNEQDLINELNSGKSIAQVAQEHNVDLNQVKQTVLADVKSQLDTAVKNGTVTQSHADNVYQKISNNIDNLLNKSGYWGPRMKPTVTPGNSG